jgi:hypothetical protein
MYVDVCRRTTENKTELRISAFGKVQLLITVLYCPALLATFMPGGGWGALLTVAIERSAASDDGF